MLQQLHDSDYRCMLESVNLSLEEGADGPVEVSGTLVFFEYQAQAPEETAQTRQSAGTEEQSS